MEYPKINGLYNRYRKDLPKEELPNGKKWGDFIDGEFAQEEFKYLFNNEWTWTEKLDGTNIRVYIPCDDTAVVIKGRTDRASLPPKLHEWILAWLLTVDKEIRTQFPSGAILYCEGVGEKIQGGSGFGQQHIKLFDVKIDTYWLSKDVVKEIANQFNLDYAPIILVGTIAEAIKYVKQKNNSTFGSFESEGLVGTPSVLLLDRKSQIIRTKIKVRDFT